jgi:hypothetical protein
VNCELNPKIAKVEAAVKMKEKQKRFSRKPEFLRQSIVTCFIILKEKC